MLDDRPGAGDVARPQRALARGGEQLGSRGRVSLGQQRERPTGERARGGEVVLAEGAVGRAGQQLGGAATERGDVLVDAPEFTAVPVRLLVVERDHGLVITDESGRGGIGPDRDLLVEVGPRGLEEPAVCRVANEHVMEPVDGLVAPVRARRLDEFFPAHRFQQRWKRRARAGELTKRAEVELRADDRREFEHRALVIREPLHAGGEQRLDRRRDLHRLGVDCEFPFVAAPADHLVVDEHAH